MADLSEPVNQFLLAGGIIGFVNIYIVKGKRGKFLHNAGHVVTPKNVCNAEIVSFVHITFITLIGLCTVMHLLHNVHNKEGVHSFIY